MVEVICAFVWFEGVEQLANFVPESGNGSLCGFAQERLELGEEQLDGIEIRGVRRQVEQLGSCCFDRLAHALDLVSGKIIHDDDIARSKRGGQALLDIGAEDRSVHRLVNDEGSGDGMIAQGRDKGGRLPVAVGHFADDALAPMSPAIKPGHIGGRAGLVDEDKVCAIKQGLILPPSSARRRHVGPVLLGGVHGFF